jgi:hypothetical protein
MEQLAIPLGCQKTTTKWLVKVRQGAVRGNRRAAYSGLQARFPLTATQYGAGSWTLGKKMPLNQRGRSGAKS